MGFWGLVMVEWRGVFFWGGGGSWGGGLVGLLVGGRGWRKGADAGVCVCDDGGGSRPVFISQPIFVV